MRTAIFYLFTALLLCSYTLSSQDSEPYVTSKKGFDIGINITSVLSSFGGNAVPVEDFDLPIFFRFTRQRSSFRIALGLDGTNSSFFDNVTFAERQSTQQTYFTKLGIELHESIDNIWQFYYGLDLLGSLANDVVDVFVGQFNSKIERQVYGVGASPFVGLRLFVGNRFYLSTEANFAYIYQFLETTESFTDINGMPDQRTSDSQASSFSITPPLHIFINYKLK